MPRLFLALGFVIVAGTFSTAQVPAVGKGADKKATANNTPITGKFAPPKGKKSPLDSIEGYKRHIIEGFTVMVNTEVLDEDAAKYERQPIDVLELEFQILLRNLAPKTADLFRKLIIWVEWDEKITLENGRGGSPVALYYGGSQSNLWKEGMNPLKSKTISIVSMRSLTAEHQPKTDSGRCVLMHEFAHVVHDQLLGRDNLTLKTAFQQAMQRRLYDRDAYISTNEFEFFAEATCAYFDNSPVFPRTREELKKHDPVTFQLIDSMWGTGKKTPTITPKSASKGPGPNGNNKYDLEVKRADVTFGDVIHGEPVTPEQLDKKVVLVATWGRGDAPLLEKLTQATVELGAFGVRIIAIRGANEPIEKAQSIMQAGKAEFSVVETATVKEKAAPQPVPLPSAHAIVFAADGTCLYRGSAYDAIPHLRSAVGKQLIADLGKSEVSKGFTNAVTALTSGEPLLTAIPKVAPLTSNADKETVAEAKSVLAALLAPGLDAIADAQSKAKSEPVVAFVAAEKVAATYKGTSVGTKATALVSSLKSNPIVGKELKARAMLEQVRTFDKYLVARPWAFDPVGSEFQRNNELPLLQLKAVLELMKKQYPDTPATVEATRIGKVYGVE